MEESTRKATELIRNAANNRGRLSAAKITNTGIPNRSVNEGESNCFMHRSMNERACNKNMNTLSNSVNKFTPRKSLVNVSMASLKSPISGKKN